MKSNKSMIIICIVIICTLSGCLYYQHQEIVKLKAEVEYQKSRVDTQKIQTDIAQERCDELAKKLDEAQTPVQVVYSNPPSSTIFPSEQEQAYTDMLNKINRNLDQQYFNSITGDY